MTPDVRRAVLADASRLAELGGTLGYPVEAEVFEERLRPEH